MEEIDPASRFAETASDPRPTDKVAEIIYDLCEWYERWVPGKRFADFAEDHLYRLAKEGVGGEELARRVAESDGPLVPVGVPHGLVFCEVAAAYCAQASRSEAQGEVSQAWSYVVEAARFAGMALGYSRGPELARLEISSRAAKAASSMHRENAALKVQAISWYHSNRQLFRSKAAAAEVISKRVVPAAYSTVRDWLKGQ